MRRLIGASASLAPILALLLLAPTAAAAASFDVLVTKDGGVTPELEAGSHPNAMTTTIDFAAAGGAPRDIQIELPPGLIENPSAVSKCSQDEFHTPRVSQLEASLSGESCSQLSQIGVAEVRAGGATRSFGIFNLEPPAGAPAAIGFSPFGVPVVFTPRIRELGGEYGTTLELRGLDPTLDLEGLTMTIWGTPWAIEHNGQRGECLNEVEPGIPFAKCPIEQGARLHLPFAYLTLPASCTGPIAFTMAANTWQNPAFASATVLSRDVSGSPAGLTGCSGLNFEPRTTAQATNPRASSPSGFDFSLTPAEEALTNPKRRVPAQARRAVVTLPEGMTVNPSLAAGLGACGPSEYAEETAASAVSAGCPETAKIGTFTVTSQLFEEPLQGIVYLAQPDDPATAAPGSENPFDSLLAVYLIAKSAARGVLIKVPGELVPNPATGRLTATFDDLPQLPYANLKLHFREGQRAPLVTPSACGAFATQVDLTPWNNPSAVAHSEPSFAIAKGIGPGESCPTGAVPPFAPAAVAGSLGAGPGTYTPFYLHLTRADSEQELTSYSATLPPGLTGKIAGIPYCPDAGVAAAKAKSGREEERHPSCPGASEIGHTTSGFGASAVLAYAPGKLYLAGPYRGSTFSVVAIDPAIVGPFDLGVVVVRSAIRVDRRTAQVSIDSSNSDPIPHILSGVPIHLRDVRVYIDRPQTTLNPTSCEPFAVVSTLTGVGPSFSNPGDDSTARVPSHYQVSNCSDLGFSPRLGFHLSGGSKRGDFPSLSADLRPRAGDANIARAAVTLPRGVFLEQGHIGTVCTQRQFDSERCPRRSVYGQATAATPLLASPLRGPVYLRSSSNTLPDLVISLRGSGIAIDLVGRIDSHRGGIRATFDTIPDAPVTKFGLTMKGGGRSILVNAEDVCAHPQRASVRLIAQDNAGQVTHPVLRANCGRR
jgi:hypothetical protein